MQNIHGGTLAVAAAGMMALAATAGCSRYSLDDVRQPDPDLAAPAPEGAVLERGDIDRHATTMAELLQGRLPGVDVRTGRRGRPSIQIRGRSSVIEDSEALIMVDGVETPANALLSMSPQDVQRIEVLKDGAAAIYGVRGANGVLLITTRRWRS